MPARTACRWQWTCQLQLCLRPGQTAKIGAVSRRLTAMRRAVEGRLADEKTKNGRTYEASLYERRSQTYEGTYELHNFDEETANRLIGSCIYHFLRPGVIALVVLQ
jgi:hypothetical protein